MKRIGSCRHFLAGHTGNRAARRWLPALLALLLAVSMPSAVAQDEPLAEMTAVLLTRDLGDPRSPGSAKLVMAFPESMANRAVTARSSDFTVYVYPARLSEQEGTADRYQAHGLYFWRFGAKMFLDVRELPKQDEAGPAKVKIVYSQSGKPRAKGFAEGSSRYTADAVDVVLAVDVSRSMLSNDRNKRRVTAAKAFIQMARQGGGVDKIGLVTFNHQIKTRTPLLDLDRTDRLLADLAGVGADGMTSLDAPLEAALDMFRREKSERPVVVLLTDGYNEGSFYRNTHLRCAREGVRIFAVGLTESADRRLLAEMANATGGMYFRAPKDEDLPEIYARLAAELGKRYLLHAQILDSREGSLSLPIDSTVKRIVAVTDGGAAMTMQGPDDRESGVTRLSGSIGSVFVGKPYAGEWTFAWQGASPGRSAMALFGDTRFFLDVFPPQLQGRKLAFGAVLAEGANPLCDAGVWVEPVPGIIAEKIQLFDDGRHGDGQAGDGVYGAVVDFDHPDVSRFDVTVRSAGKAWDKGYFVRQTAALTIRTPEEIEAEPPKPQPQLDSDIDFGVLFPGETGTSVVETMLDGGEPGEYSFRLEWPNQAEAMPALASDVTINPGRQSFELEMTVPEQAEPGHYLGTFTIEGEEGIADRKDATVTVGTVLFAEPDIVDLGVVPPGTSRVRRVRISVQADKAVPLSMTAAGDDGLSAKVDEDRVEAGASTVTVEISASSNIGDANGDMAGMVTLTAGPGMVDIPVIWTVQSYSLAPLPEVGEPEGLPAVPAALPEPEALEFDFQDSQPAVLPGPDSVGLPDSIADSPWDRVGSLVDKALDRGGPEVKDGLDAGQDQAQPEQPGLSGDITSPGLAEPATRASASRDSFWSAWWMYILAALILLILLLLLLAYILYRLGKSSMVRFLLISAVVNLILLAIFIALLDNSAPMTFEQPAMIAVTLSEEGPDERIAVSAGQSGMLAQGGGSAQDYSAAGPAEAEGELVPGVQSVLPTQRLSGIAASQAEAAELAAAMSPGNIELEKDRGESLARRERLPQRGRREAPMPELPEITDPFEKTESREIGENNYEEAQADSGEQVRIDAEIAPQTPIWAGEETNRQAVGGGAVPRFTDAAETEIVELEATPVVVDPRERRRRPEKSSPDLTPEPRVEINDPRREESREEVALQEAASREEGEVAETRVEPNQNAMPLSAAKPALVQGETAMVDVLPGGSAAPVGYDGEVVQAAVPGRLERRGGRRGGMAETPGGGVGLSLLRAGGDEGGQGEKSFAATGQKAASLGESRYDNGAAAAEGDAAGLYEALAQKGALDSGRAPRASQARLGNGLDDSQEQIAYGGDGQSGGTLPQSGPSGNRGSRHGGRLDNGEPAVGSDIGENNPNQSGVGRNANPSQGNGVADSGSGGDGDGGWDFGAGGSGFDAINGGRRLDAAGALDKSDLGLARRLPSATLNGIDVRPERISPVGVRTSEDNWSRNQRTLLRRGGVEATSALDANSLLIVVGDFSRLPDSASENLFAALLSRRRSQVTLEERNLQPGDSTLGDCLLALVTPEEARDWSDDAYRSVAEYLRNGGHIWIDASRPGGSDAFMQRLADLLQGDYQPLPARHQLAENGETAGLFLGDELAAVATSWNWRKDWRYHADKNGKTLRFLARTLNYFLSGDADNGIEIDDIVGEGGLDIVAGGEQIPEVIASPAQGDAARIWINFAPGEEQSWQTASWGDRLALSTATDGSAARP